MSFDSDGNNVSGGDGSEKHLEQEVGHQPSTNLSDKSMKLTTEP